jgi:3-phenylpropionate/cinnamic acid dioxygenase small subunit
MKGLSPGGGADAALHARAGVTMLAAVDEELRRAIVRGEIHDLLARFAHCLDAGEFDRLEGMFAEDATFAVEPDPGIVPACIDGSSAIRAAFEARRASYADQAQRRHVVSTIVVDEISADRAHARSFLTIISTPSEGGAIELRGSGVYDDVFARSEQGWRFAERRLTLDGFNAGPG